MSQTTLPMDQRLLHWSLSGDTGTSSQTLACAVLGIRKEDRAFGFDVPHDYSDFGRCYRLVQLVPEILTMWDKVIAACPAWGPIAERWDEVVACYEADMECQVSDTCRHLLRTLRDQYRLERDRKEGL